MRNTHKASGLFLPSSQVESVSSIHTHTHTVYKLCVCVRTRISVRVELFSLVRILTRNQATVEVRVPIKRHSHRERNRVWGANHQLACMQAQKVALACRAKKSLSRKKLRVHRRETSWKKKWKVVLVACWLICLCWSSAWLRVSAKREKLAKKRGKKEKSRSTWWLSRSLFTLSTWLKFVCVVFAHLTHLKCAWSICCCCCCRCWCCLSASFTHKQKAICTFLQARTQIFNLAFIESRQLKIRPRVAVAVAFVWVAHSIGRAIDQVAAAANWSIWKHTHNTRLLLPTVACGTWKIKNKTARATRMLCARTTRISFSLSLSLSHLFST